MRHPVVIVGGGAAGLMAAIYAGRSGGRPILLEGAKVCGLKIVVSGGGRCNVLPSEVDDSDYFTSGSRNVMKRIFRTWRLSEVQSFFETDLRIPLVREEDTGKLFPADQRARTVRDRLVEAVAESGCEVQTGARVTSLETAGGGFRIGLRFASGESRPLTASRVIIASGGQSLPKTGSDGAGYGMARKLGHSVLAPYPALVALRSEAADLRALAGISLPVRWRVRDERGRVREERVRELLFTHDGFSGPSILDASHWAVREGLAIEVTWGDIPEDTWREHLSSGAKKTVVNLIANHLPRRLARAMCERAGIDEELRVAQLPRDRRRSLLDHLVRFPLPVSGDHGFRTAEVTGGGIPLGEIAPATLESRKTAGLFLCGEILDVIGRIGGYNFLWAWVTGRLAGESAARAASPDDS